jgi:hypothetical protein
MPASFKNFMAKSSSKLPRCTILIIPAFIIIRVGTPAVTSRGLKGDDMRDLARAITLVLDKHDSEEVKEEAQRIVKTLCDKYPLYA